MEFRALASSSSGNCYLVSEDESSILIDCGIPWKKIQQAMHFQTHKILAAFVSHHHQDHARSITDVCRAGIDVYSPIAASHHRSKVLQDSRSYAIGKWWGIRTFGVRHDEPCFGFLVASGRGKLLYLIDTPFSPARFVGLTHIAIEVNHSLDLIQERVESGDLNSDLAKRIIRNHMSLERAVKFLRATDLSQVREIHLLHLSDDNSDEQQFKEVVMKATGKPVFVAGKEERRLN